MNTPYYMTVSGPDGFQYNNPGYEMHLDGLLEGELTFTLCAEQSPKRPAYHGVSPADILLIGNAVLMTVAIVVVFSRTARKTK